MSLPFSFIFPKKSVFRKFYYKFYNPLILRELYQNERKHRVTDDILFDISCYSVLNYF